MPVDKTCDQLRKERDQERRVRETAERESRQHAERTAELYLEREKLAAEVAGLREDKARLEWIEKNGLVGSSLWRGVPGNGWLVVGQDRGYATLREALDAARKQATEGAEPSAPQAPEAR